MKNKKTPLFERFATWATKVTGRPIAFILAALAILGREKFMTNAEMNALPEADRQRAQQAVYEVVQDKIRNFLRSDGHAS